MRRGLAGSTLLALIGIAALQAQPPTPTRTPTAVKRAPTPGAASGGSTTGRPGDGNAPVRTDSTVASPVGDPSKALSDVSAQYGALESSIEAAYQRLSKEQKDGIDELEARIAEINEQIRQAQEMQEKLDKMMAAVDRLWPKFQEYMSSANNLKTKTAALEAKAQNLKASLLMRTPVPKTPTKKAKG